MKTLAILGFALCSFVAAGCASSADPIDSTGAASGQQSLTTTPSGVTRDAVLAPTDSADCDGGTDDDAAPPPPAHPCWDNVMCIHYSHWSVDACRCVPNEACTADGDCPNAGSCVVDPFDATKHVCTTW